MITSGVTGIRYDEKDIIKIYNTTQSARYIQNAAKIIDIGVNEDGKLWIGFYRKSVSILFDKWVRHQL